MAGTAEGVGTLPERLFVVISRQVGSSFLVGIVRQRKFSLLQRLPRAAYLRMCLEKKREKWARKVLFCFSHAEGTTETLSHKLSFF